MAQSRGKGNVLTDKDMNEEEKHALGKTGAGLLESKFVSLPRNVQKACQDDAFVRAVQTELRLKKPPARSLLETAIKRYRAQPTPEPSKKERRAPRRRTPPSPIAPPPPKRPATAKPAALTEQGQNTSTIMAVGPPTALVATAQRALGALAGELETCATAAKIVEVKKAGGVWVEYESQSVAVLKVAGLKKHVLADLLKGGTSDKFEARLVSDKRPISKRKAYMDAASELGFRHSLLLAADLDAAVSELVPRAVLPDSVKERPPSWEGLLRCVVALPSRDQRALVEQTRRAEDKRVLELSTSNLLGGHAVRDAVRREEAAASAEADEECQRWVERLIADAQKVDNETIVFGKELAAGCAVRVHPLDDRKRLHVSADDVAEFREEARRRPVWMCRAQPGDEPDEWFEVKRGRVGVRVVISVARPDAAESCLALCSGTTAGSRYADIPTEDDRAALFLVRDGESQMLLETVYHQALGKAVSLVITGGQKPVDVAAGRVLDGIDLLAQTGIFIDPSSVKRPTTSYEVAIDACGSCCLGFDEEKFGKISVLQLQRELAGLVALKDRLKSLGSGALKVGHRRTAAGSMVLTNYSRSIGPTQQMIEAMSMLKKMGFTATASLCRVLGAEGNWHSEVVFYDGDGKVHHDPLVVLVCSTMQQTAAAGRRKMFDNSMASRK